MLVRRDRRQEENDEKQETVPPADCVWIGRTDKEDILLGVERRDRGTRLLGVHRRNHC